MGSGGTTSVFAKCALVLVWHWLCISIGMEDLKHYKAKKRTMKRKYRKLFATLQGGCVSSEAWMGSGAVGVNIRVICPQNYQFRRQLLIAVADRVEDVLGVCNISEIVHSDTKRKVIWPRPPVTSQSYFFKTRTPLERLGSALKARRLELGLTQAEASKLAVLSRTHLSRIEQGKRLPQESTLERLAHGLRIPCWDLYRKAKEDRYQLKNLAAHKRTLAE